MEVKFNSQKEIDKVMYSIDYLMGYYENNFRFEVCMVDLSQKDIQKDLKVYIDNLEVLQLIKNSYNYYDKDNFIFKFEPNEFLTVAIFLYKESKIGYGDKVYQGIECIREHMALSVNYVDKNNDDKKPDIEFIEPINHSDNDRTEITDKMVGFMRDVTRESSDNSEESSD